MQPSAWVQAPRALAMQDTCLDERVSRTGRPDHPRAKYTALGGLIGLAVAVGYTMQNMIGSPPPADAGRVAVVSIGGGAAIGWIVGDAVARRRDACRSG